MVFAILKFSTSVVSVPSTDTCVHLILTLWHPKVPFYHFTGVRNRYRCCGRNSLFTTTAHDGPLWVWWLLAPYRTGRSWESGIDRGSRPFLPSDDEGNCTEHPLNPNITGMRFPGLLSCQQTFLTPQWWLHQSRILGCRLLGMVHGDQGRGS